MVEQELAAHPDILECCVVARTHPKWAESGHAFIVLNSRALKRFNKAEEAKWHEDIRKYCKGKMSGFAVPQWFEIVEELPKTSTGKVQKNVLRERVKKLDSRDSKL
jgi:acyl-CoA synthetase (AMP-forming)/AMP-acid ligase II